MATWNYKQLFNALNDGDLAGQDNWEDYYENANAIIGNYIPYEGARCVRMANSASHTYYKRAVGPFENGIVYVAVKKTTTDNDTEFFVGTIDIILSSDEKIYTWDVPSSSYKEIGNWSTDTWHKIGVKFDCSTNQFWVNIGDGDWVGPYGMASSTPAANINIIWIGTNKNSGDYVYYDTITYSKIGPFPTHFRI